MAATGFKNPDLAQIWEALQEGTVPDSLYLILNALMPTNNLVSITKFEADVFYSGDPVTPGVFELYDAWITAHPDWVILNETQYTDNTSGRCGMLVRYRGEKLTADEG